MTPTTLHCDAPIVDPDQDRLNRTPFAQAIAESILSLPTRDSFVFGLCGPWGSGKTSVINLLLKNLQSDESGEKPIVLKFNPWWFSGQENLLPAFLEQLAQIFEREDERGVADLLAMLSRGLRPLSLLSLVGEAARRGTEVGTTLEELSTHYADADEKVAAETRQQLDELLAKESRKTVIIMDDIDRLTPKEMAEVFLILKAVANFPRTIYLLAFDHDVVEKAVSSHLSVAGRLYLEKIIQLQIDLPTPSETALHRIALEDIGSIWGVESPSSTEKTEFGNIFHDGVKSFLVTPRSITKLLNVLQFTYPPLHGELFFPDMLGVACLMAFAPGVVRTIGENASLFTGCVYFGHDRSEEERFHKGWLENVEEEIREPVEGIVKRLFPKVETALGGPSYGPDWESRWRSELRCRSDKHFDKYFRLALPRGALSEAEWTELVGDLGTLDFDKAVIAFAEQEGRHGIGTRIQEFLDRALDYAKNEASVEQAEELFRSLVRIGDGLSAIADEEVVFVVGIENELRLDWVLLQSLETLADHGSRETTIREAIADQYGWRTMSGLLLTLGRQHGMFGEEETSSKEETLVSREFVNEVAGPTAEAMLSKMEKEDAESHFSNPSFIYAIRNLRLLGPEGRAVKCVRSVASTDQGVVGILGQMATVRRSQTGSDRVYTESLSVDAQWLERYFDLSELSDRCTTILEASPEWLDEPKRQLLGVTLASVAEHRSESSGGKEDR